MRFILVISTFFACLFSVTAVDANDAARLLKVIQSNETSAVDRANAFQKIGDIAGEDIVKPLAVFLNNNKWSHYARFAFQKMEGDNVTDVLLRSLDTLQGELKLGVIGTIGHRRDPIAVPGLVKLLASDDANVSAAASVALATIGTTAAATALIDTIGSTNDPKIRESLASSLLVVGQRLVKSGKTKAAIGVFDRLRTAEVPKPFRIGATQNAILARGTEGVELMVEQLKSPDRDYFRTGLMVSRVLSGEQVTKAVIDSLETESSPQRQVFLILSLRDRQDKQATSAILKKIKSDSPEVQLSAIEAVGTLGDGSSVAALLSVVNSENSGSVLDSLVALKGSGVNAALMKAAAPPKTSTVAVKALGQRRVKEAVQLLFQLSEADSAVNRQEAIVALGMALSQDRFLDLFALLKSAKNGERKKAIQKAIHEAVYRSTQPDACAEALCAMIPSSSGADRDFLLEQVRTAGGKRAIALMREFATGTDETLQDAATKTLGRWLSADAAPILLQVAQGGGKFANRALGGYIRIFRQFELPESERVAMAAQALKVARRSTERNTSLDAMTRFPGVGTFELALGQLNVPGSEAAAAKAILYIGRTVMDLDPETGKAGFKKLINANVSKDITESAKSLLP